METEQQKTERYMRMSEASFAMFKQNAKEVPGMNGVVERELDGERYRLRLWTVRRAMQEWKVLVQAHGEAIAVGVLGFIRYTTKRQGEEGKEIVHLADIDRGEELLAQAVREMIEQMPADKELYDLCKDYFESILTRRVLDKKGKEHWVPVVETIRDASEVASKPGVYISGDGSFTEDIREMDDKPIGFDNFYIRKISSMYRLMFWILAENLGGFFLDLYQHFFPVVSLKETRSSSNESKQAT